MYLLQWMRQMLQARLRTLVILYPLVFQHPFSQLSITSRYQFPGKKMSSFRLQIFVHMLVAKFTEKHLAASMCGKLTFQAVSSVLLF